MLDLALIGSAALLGVAGMTHCTAMCGATCTALTGGARPPAESQGCAAPPVLAPSVGPAARSAPAVRLGHSANAALIGFHLARVASYAAGGAVAAASMGALAGLAQWSPALRPLWTLLHVAALALGVFLLWQGRQPAWLSAFGRGGVSQRTLQAGGPQSAAAGGWQPVTGPGLASPRGASRQWKRFPVRAVSAGALWVAWPCGLLQSALLVAAMANTPWGGGAAMAAFALASSGGLLLAPWAWRRWGSNPRAQVRAVRAAGVMLAGASAFALMHGLSPAFAAFCATL